MTLSVQLGEIISGVCKVPSSVNPVPIFVVLEVFPDCVFVFLSGAIIGTIIEVCIVATVLLVSNISKSRVPIILSFDLYFITVFCVDCLLLIIPIDFLPFISFELILSPSKRPDEVPHSSSG